MESFFATLKSECIVRHIATGDEARANIFHYIEIWYNRQRRHSTLGHLSLTNFERPVSRDKINVHKVGQSILELFHCLA
jgi:transposase InsO family protein